MHKTHLCSRRRATSTFMQINIVWRPGKASHEAERRRRVAPHLPPPLPCPRFTVPSYLHIPAFPTPCSNVVRTLPQTCPLPVPMLTLPSPFYTPPCPDCSPFLPFQTFSHSVLTLHVSTIILLCHPAKVLTTTCPQSVRNFISPCH